MGYKVLVKKDINRDLAVLIGILKVTEDLNVCEGIHHKGNHLQGKSQHLLKRFIFHKATASPSHFSCCHHQDLMHISLALASSKRFLYSHSTPGNSLCPSMQSIGLERFFFHLLSYTFTSSFPTQFPVNVAKLEKLLQQSLDSRQTISTPVLPMFQAATGELAQMGSLLSDLTNPS